MLEVLEAFAVISVVVAVGALVGRTGCSATTPGPCSTGWRSTSVCRRCCCSAVGGDAATDLLVVAAGVGTGRADRSDPRVLVFTAVRKRDRGDAVIAAWTSSYVNAGNLGIPLSAYVFGSTTEISALILFQAAVMAPMGIAILNSATTPRPSPARQVVALVTNPIIAASVLGLIFAAVGLKIEGPVADPLELLADLAIPTVLLAFGISLTSGIGNAPPTNRIDLAITVFLKTLLMPAMAFAIARWGFGADPEHVLLVAVLAALPSAQNINTYAAVYRRNESLARDATLISTAVSVPIIVSIVGILR